MLLTPAPLLETTALLRSGELDLHTYLDRLCDHIERVDAQVQAFLPEAHRRVRLHAAADALLAAFPTPAGRPALFGIPAGIKDVFRVEGFPTQAGAAVPATRLADEEAVSVRRLRAAGGLIAGKTVTTEFAYFEPGPTRNPHNLAHTPGGSSSGSAAAVVAGLCPLAFGTQTIGSVIRPAVSAAWSVSNRRCTASRRRDWSTFRARSTTSGCLHRMWRGWRWPRRCCAMAGKRSR